MGYLAIAGFVFLWGHVVHYLNQRDRQRQQQ